MNIIKFGIVLLLGLGSFTYADDIKAKTVIILDASGSMWGQINKIAKITTAKKALNDFVRNWDENKMGELGITVYGHRKKTDCKDIEAIVPIGSVGEKAKKEIYKKIKQIKAKGKTPISLAIEQEARKLKRSGSEIATIILISDGIDSCNGDPCKTAKRLAKEGVNIKIPVIGFDVDKKAKKQLECIATATGAEFFSSDTDSAGLAKDIKDAIESTKVKVIANDDDFVSNVINSKIGGKVGNIISNDLVNDKQADMGSLNIDLGENKNINVDEKGDLIVKKGYPLGEQKITYIICDKRWKDNCDVAKVSFIVKNITNTSITSEENGEKVSAKYQFFTMNKHGEADEKLKKQCSSSKNEPCALDLKKGKYLILSTSGDKKGEALISIEKDRVLKENEMVKIIVDMK